jgi:hypothetical protein
MACKLYKSNNNHIKNMTDMKTTEIGIIIESKHSDQIGLLVVKICTPNNENDIYKALGCGIIQNPAKVRILLPGELIEVG